MMNTKSRHFVATFVALALSALPAFSQNTPTVINAPAGIGITAPQGTLHIHNATAFDPVQPFDPNPRNQIFDNDYNTTLRFTNPNTDTTATDGFAVVQENYHVVMKNSEKGFIRLRTLGGSAYLSETGRFGIGDTSSSHKFNVQGTSRLGGNTTISGTLTATGNATLGGSLAVGSAFLVSAAGAVQMTSLAVGNGITASSGSITASNHIAVGSTYISSTLGIYHGNGFQLTNAGNLTLQGGVTAGGNAIFGGSLSVGDGFYCDAQGNAKVKELRVTLTDWPDYVFGEGYRLMPLGEVEGYIAANGHLPQMPSAAEVEAEGADLGEMNRLLMQKVEELTLYVIDLQKQIEDLKSK